MFEWYDAWILAAVVYASDGKEPVPLWLLIGTADALNKAIVSRSELELTIGRLVSAGYVRVVSEGFEATSKALALRAPGPPVENVANAIGAAEWSAQTEMPQTAGCILRDRWGVRESRKEVSKGVLEGVSNAHEGQMTPNHALLTDPFNLLRRACGAAKRER